MLAAFLVLFLTVAGDLSLLYVALHIHLLLGALWFLTSLWFWFKVFALAYSKWMHDKALAQSLKPTGRQYTDDQFYKDGGFK